MPSQDLKNACTVAPKHLQLDILYDLTRRFMLLAWTGSLIENLELAELFQILLVATKFFFFLRIKEMFEY